MDRRRRRAAVRRRFDGRRDAHPDRGRGGAADRRGGRGADEPARAGHRDRRGAVRRARPSARGERAARPRRAARRRARRRATCCPARRSPTRWPRASTSRSWTCRGASARTSRRSTAGRWTAGSSARSTRRRRARSAARSTPPPGIFSKYWVERHDPARGDRAGHLRAARHVRPRLHRALLRGSGLPGPRELHRQHEPRARPLRRPAARRLARDQLLLQHAARRPRTRS